MMDISDTAKDQRQPQQQQHQPPPAQQSQSQSLPQGGSPTTKPDAVTEKKDDKAAAAAPVRKRLSLACTTCRQRKVKCDGGRPSCRTCAKFNWPCIYQPSNRKRGPRPRALALMDGSMPYTTARGPWSSGTTTTMHSYYAYGMPGPPPPPMSPPMPMPPGLHQLGPGPMGGGRIVDIPQNGAVVRPMAGYEQAQMYHHDAFSTYGDFISSTGGIRIRPAGPPPSHMAMPPQYQQQQQHRQHMHSPPFNAASPPAVAHMHGSSGGGGGPARHHRTGSSSHYQPVTHAPQQHRMSVPDTAAMAPCPVYGPPPPQGPASMSQMHHPPTSPLSPPPPPGSSAFSHSGVQRHAAHSAAAAAAAASDQLHMGPPLATKLAPKPAINPRLGSTAPQQLQPSAQSYTMTSAVHAQNMQLASTDAPLHTSAIYARDVASSRSSSASGNAGPAAYDPADLLPVSARDRDHGSDPAARPLPFSDGLSRPRLPPLSEVLGKDYQLILSPSDGGSSVPLRPPAADPAAAATVAAATHFGLAPPHRRDTFAGEAPRVHAYEGTR
ncbi:hypothetical protein GGF46_000819 [Coemansia sp. RSA 552]|nr:hypothetical protein GGF46_000819 [Coemansia sp. RSA 552]